MKNQRKPPFLEKQLSLPVHPAESVRLQQKHLQSRAQILFWPPGVKKPFKKPQKSAEN